MFRFVNEHWVGEQQGQCGAGVFCKGSGAVVYTYNADDDESDNAYDEKNVCANANLIAHAPDMYRMLKSILETKKCSLQAVKALVNEIENI